MDRVTSKGNEAKSKMKQLSDMPTPRFEYGWSQRSVVQHATVRQWRCLLLVLILTHEGYKKQGYNPLSHQINFIRSQIIGSTTPMLCEKNMVLNKKWLTIMA